MPCARPTLAIHAPCPRAHRGHIHPYTLAMGEERWAGTGHLCTAAAALGWWGDGHTEYCGRAAPNTVGATADGWAGVVQKRRERAAAAAQGPVMPQHMLWVGTNATAGACMHGCLLVWCVTPDACLNVRWCGHCCMVWALLHASCYTLLQPSSHVHECLLEKRCGRAVQSRARSTQSRARCRPS